VKYLVDEQMSGVVSQGMRAVGLAYGEEWVHIRDDLGRGGAQDPEIPPLCRAEGIDVLVTMNVRDFGARKHYYASLTEHGVHVVVVRPSKLQPDAGQQLSLVAGAHSGVRKLLGSATEPSLVRVTHSGATVTSLQDLLREIEGDRRLP
jgi:hypothetical protein